MTSLIEMFILWLGNGVITALIVVLNDRIFKKRIEKILDKVAIYTKLLYSNKVVQNGGAH